MHAAKLGKPGAARSAPTPRATAPGARSGLRHSLSLVIVTYRRERELLEALEKLAPWGSWFLEIIIVDNDRAVALDESARALLGERCRIIRPEHNLGAVGRSLGILASRGDLVVTLDDDVRLLDPSQLTHLDRLMSADPSIGCVNFKIVYRTDRSLDLSDWCHPRPPGLYQDRLFDTVYISEGACAFNGELVRSLGGYSQDLHIGQEGLELAARILDAGYGIYYLPQVCVDHGLAREGRTPGRQFYFNARNIYWVALRCYPLGLASRTVLREWSLLMLLALWRGRLGAFLNGCREGLAGSRRIWRQRKPINARASQTIRSLNRLKPSILQRLTRVVSSRTLN